VPGPLIFSPRGILGNLISEAVALLPRRGSKGSSVFPQAIYLIFAHRMWKVCTNTTQNKPVSCRTDIRPHHAFPRLPFSHGANALKVVIVLFDTTTTTFTFYHHHHHAFPALRLPVSPDLVIHATVLVRNVLSKASQPPPHTKIKLNTCIHSKPHHNTLKPRSDHPISAIIVPAH